MFRFHLPKRLSVPVASLSLLALVTLAAVAGYEGRRVAQVVVLALPAVLWLLWPLKSTRWRSLRFAVAGLLIGLFLIDGAVRAFMRMHYQASPESSLVLAAVANTTPREALEYASSQALTLAGGGAALIASLWLVAALVGAANRRSEPLRLRSRWVFAVLMALCLAGLLSKPWRRHHPVLFWPNWVASVGELRSAWSNQENERAKLLANALAAGARTSMTGPSTVVLVLTDSINRDNMGLYGYSRDTTPHLAQLAAAERGQFLKLQHAWSVQPSTLASLSGLFSFGARDEDDPVNKTHHLLALARAAGYRVWWMSNHDDVAIEQQHARLADSLEMINREPGRSTAMLDGELLDCLKEALIDPAPRKLIIVHLLGAHPHYRLRAPADFTPFAEETDGVERDMMRRGKPAWLRAARRSYDTAIRYHDSVVAETLRLSRHHTPGGGHASWMFLSDHGQEVGHERVFAGHSPSTAAGYRIPALLWRSAAPFDAAITSRPFRADWAGWTLASLMGLQWRGQASELDVLSPSYAWQAPQLQVKAVRYDQ
ncbi:sulfatase-like hydrolase/transferase [Roseateles sp.]|uniref:sulfatase-like hydrolase/transferase n=1 Tax=Roseateles sp. TaxID=1971397 RepID=UPI003BAC6F98